MPAFSVSRGVFREVCWLSTTLSRHYKYYIHTDVFQRDTSFGVCAGLRRKSPLTKYMHTYGGRLLNDVGHAVPAFVL